MQGQSSDDRGSRERRHASGPALLIWRCRNRGGLRRLVRRPGRGGRSPTPAFFRRRALTQTPRACRFGPSRSHSWRTLCTHATAPPPSPPPVATPLILPPRTPPPPQPPPPPL